MPDAKRRSRALPALVAIVSLAAVASLAAPAAKVAWAAGGVGSIRGKLTGWDKLVPQVYADAAKPDSHRYVWREPSPTVKQDFRKLTANVSRDACVAAFGSGNAQAHEPIIVKVTGGRLTPSTIVLSVGSRISFRNVDPFPHVLYEVEDPKWGPNPTGPSSTREWAATAPGVHTIRDQLFPSMVMHVVVDPAAAEFALPDHDGAFTMPLPAGEYTLKVFFDGKQVGKDVAGLKVGERALEIKEAIPVGSPGSASGDSK
jgi:plastocyanin